MTIATPQWAPAADLQREYRQAGLWPDQGLGAYLSAMMTAWDAGEVHFWSDDTPAHSTFGEVHAAARSFAAGLMRRGVAPGDVVSYQLPNRLEALIALYGIAMAGAVVVPIVHFYGPRELEFILGQLGAKAHVTADAWGHLDYLANLDDMRPRLDALESVVVVGPSARPWSTPFEAVVGETPFAELPPVDPMMPAVVAYTSGTTAEPKGVVHTSNSFLGEVEQLRRYDVGASRPLLTGAPLAHAMGMISGALLPLVRRQPAHIIDRWDPGNVLEIVEQQDLSSGSGATFFLTSLLDSPDFTPRHAELIERTGLGGSSVPASVGDRAESVGIEIVRSYGSTEHPTSTGSDRHDTPQHRKYTDGRSLPGCEVRIVDESVADVDPGVVGEILSRGPDLFFGYTDPDLTAKAIDPDGWYHTDDLGSLDEEGYLTVADRKKDIIIRGGENISAAEVEEILAQLPNVSEVAVVAAPDQRLGEHACAMYMLVPGAEPVSLDEVRAHFSTVGIARQKWPEELRVVADFPRTPSGKVKKKDLRDLLRAEP